MSWKLQKYVLFVLMLLLMCGLFFLVGVSFGASITTKQFIELLVPVFSVVGTWVSSIAAIMAVFVALWLAEQQRVRECEKLDITLACVFTQFRADSSYCVKVVSSGAKPSIVNSISLLVDNSDAVYFITNLELFGSQLPISLSYGQTAEFFLKESFAGEIKEYVATQGSGSSKLKLMVNSTTSCYSIDVTNNI